MKSLSLNPYTLRLVRLTYGSPADILRCVGIGIRGVTAGHALKVSLCLAVLFVHMTALRASPARVARVNELYWDADKLCLVGNLGLQVLECPRMQTSHLLSVSPYPIMDMRQILQRNSTLGAFSFSDYLFGNLVINLTGKPPFSTGEPAQHTLCRACSLALQSTALPEPPIAYPSDFPRISKDSTVGTGRDIGESKIDTEPVAHGNRPRFLHFNHYVQKPLPVTVYEIGLPPSKGQPLQLLGIAGERHLNASAHRPNTDGLVPQVEREDARAIRNTAALPESAHTCLGQLIRLVHLGEHASCHPGADAKLLAHEMVKPAMHSELSKLPLAQGKWGNAIAGGIARLNGADEHLMLFRRGQQLDLRYYLQPLESVMYSA